MKARIYGAFKKSFLENNLRVFRDFFKKYFLVWGDSFPSSPYLIPLAFDLGDNFFRSHLNHSRYDILASGHMRHVGTGVLDPTPRATAT